MAKDYVKLIIDSWVQNAQKIENIFYREFKAADKEDIPPDELFDYLKNTVDWLEQQRQRPYHKQLELWNDFVLAKEAKGEVYDMPMPEDTYTLATSHLTDFRICLQLSKGELLYIKESIESAYKKYSQPKTDSFKTDFVKTYNDEVTPERIADLKEKLSKIEPYSKRIEFLHNEKLKYLQEISPETLFISGVTSTAMGTRASLFFDRWIDLEIKNERLKSIPVIETKKQNEAPKFEDIKDLQITEQVKFAVDFYPPKRVELFNNIIEALKDEKIKQNVLLIQSRIDNASFKISGYTNSEIEHYQSIFAKDFYTVLHSENYQTYIEDKIRELHFICSGLEQDLRTKQYDFLDDREQEKIQLTETNRYKNYLENLLIHFTEPQQDETKTGTLKAPVLGIFCNLINEIGIEIKGEAESAESYCRRICEKFTLPYSDRVRQNYNTNRTTKHLKELENKILPLLHSDVRLQIETHLSTKHPPKQNLYV